MRSTHWGYICKNMMLNFIVVEEEDGGSIEEVGGKGDGEMADDEGEEIMQTSISALMGNPRHKIIRILEDQTNEGIYLIDSGSTHSFIDERLVQDLGIPTDPLRG
ncbi:Uncharacterized protein Adt_27344 [Abeliophyllum distichum]|uniref:Gag-pol polyprotein n=1 Tax=Abeliophyllum distichum TaxID=126358 RepID=A0ABD1RU71_9LAMI